MIPSSSRRNSFSISRSPKTTELLLLLGPRARWREVLLGAAQLAEQPRRRRRDLAAARPEPPARADRIEQRVGDGRVDHRVVQDAGSADRRRPRAARSRAAGGPAGSPRRPRRARTRAAACRSRGRRRCTRRRRGPAAGPRPSSGISVASRSRSARISRALLRNQRRWRSHSGSTVMPAGRRLVRGAAIASPRPRAIEGSGRSFAARDIGSARRPEHEPVEAVRPERQEVGQRRRSAGSSTRPNISTGDMPRNSRQVQLDTPATKRDRFATTRMRSSS